MVAFIFMNEAKENKPVLWKFLLRAIVCGLIGFLLFIAIFFRHPSGAYQSTPQTICLNNLRQIDYAANEFAVEHQLNKGDRINFPNDLTPYIKLNRDGKIPACPQGGIYHISKVGEPPTCSLGTTVTPAHVLQ